MDFSGSNRLANAFSLVELLTVIAIIAILAALLLPVLSKSQMRAKRIWCVSNLREVGIAFHAFAHDHNSRFPMTVPVNEGGSREFVQNGYRVNGPFYFAFRHFQTLSNTLVTPKVLICPADTRLVATNFAALKNANVSYFVGVNAEYSRPASILAGDGNLATSPQSPTIVRSDADVRLQWTSAQHAFKGNLLFADGHLEEWGGSLNGNVLARAQNFVLPSIGPGNSSPAASNSNRLPTPSTTRNLTAASDAEPGRAGGDSEAATPPQPNIAGPTNTAVLAKPKLLPQPLKQFPITLTPAFGVPAASSQLRTVAAAEAGVRTNPVAPEPPVESVATTNAAQKVFTADQPVKPSSGPLKENWLWVWLLLVILLVIILAIVILTTLVKTNRKVTP